MEVCGANRAFDLGLCKAMRGNRMPVSSAWHYRRPQTCSKQKISSEFFSPGCNCIGIIQKVFSEKASAIARMRQKCIRNASEMRQKCVRHASKWVLFYWEKRNVQNASEIRQNCVKNASKMRGTPLGENTFWTIPITDT